MPKLNIVRHHSLEIDDAKARVHALVSEIQNQFPSLISSVHWSSDGRSAKVTGSMFDGNFEVDLRQVTIQINLSFLASPFRSRIEGQITQVLDQRFGAA